MTQNIYYIFPELNFLSFLLAWINFPVTYVSESCLFPSAFTDQSTHLLSPKATCTLVAWTHSYTCTRSPAQPANNYLTPTFVH